MEPAVAQQPLTEPPPIEAGIAPPPGPYAHGFDALHYEIGLTLPDSGSYIEGTTLVQIRLDEAAPDSHRRDGAPPDTLRLDFTGLAVGDVRVDGQQSNFHFADGKINIPIPASAEVGDTLSVSIVYQGVPDDGLILGENMHGAPTIFADNWPNRARFWFPSIDHPSDKATVNFEIRVDSGSDRAVIANGRRLDSDDPSVWRWAVSKPIPTYTMVVGAAEFVVNGIGEVCSDRSCAEVTTWLYPPDSARGARSFQRADEMLSYYSTLIAPFPYEKLAHVQSSTRFGGMENVSAIFYSEVAIADGRDIEATVAHETAHQWFGDAVTEADWHHLWLSEGFATYFGALFFEHADGPDRFAEMMRESRQAYLSSDVVERPIVDPEQDNLFRLLNANNYSKGSWVVHMLRRSLGDDVFFDAIREYYRTYEHGTALTKDLRRTLEKASGEDLGQFFEQWVFSPGHPVLEVTWTSAPDGAQVRIDQVQPAEWPTFHTPLTLAFQTPDGPVVREVQLDDRMQDLVLELPAEPTTLEIDPNGDLLVQVLSIEKGAATVE